MTFYLFNYINLDSKINLVELDDIFNESQRERRLWPYNPEARKLPGPAFPYQVVGYLLRWCSHVDHVIFAFGRLYYGFFGDNWSTIFEGSFQARAMYL